MKGKKYLGVLLSVLIILSVCIMPTSAAEADSTEKAAAAEEAAVGEKSGKTGDCTWTLDNKGVLTISGSGKMDDYSKYYSSLSKTYNTNAPWEKLAVSKVVIGGGVTRIGSYAFFNCTSIREAVVSGSVSNIRYSSFEGCSGLTEISVSDGVTTIEDSAFKNCTGMKSISIGSGVKTIEKYAFMNCAGAKELTFESGVKSIKDGAFKGCSGLTELTFPDSLNNISPEAFMDCDSLKSVIVPKSLIYVGKDAFNNCRKLNAVYISDLAAWCGIWFHFENSNPLFYARKLYLNNELVTDLTIPDGVTQLRDYTFVSCTSLKSVTISDSVSSIQRYTFRDCVNLESVIIPDSVKNIGEYAFSGCTKLTNAEIPDSVTTVSPYAFKNCVSLKSVVIPDSVKYLGEAAFSGCSGMTDVTISCSITNIVNNTFSDCVRLKGVRIPYGVTNIGYNAFSGCVSLSNVSIPGTVNSIAYSAFENCHNLKNVIVPETVKSIGENAFGVYVVDSDVYKVKDFSITGIKGSAAEYYAEKNNLTFIPAADNRILWGEKSTVNKDEWTGRDNLGFINEWGSFVKSDSENRYVISDDYLYKLKEHLTSTTKKSIQEYADSNWGGSCYGMAAVVSLIKTGYLTPSVYQQAANTAHDLNRPVDNDKVMNLVNFYHLSQRIPDVEKQIHSYQNERTLLRKTVEEAEKVKLGGMPVMLCFSWQTLDKGEYAVSTLEEKKAAIKNSNYTNEKGISFSFSEDQVESMTEINGKTFITIDNALNEIFFSDRGTGIELREEGKKDTNWWKYVTYGHAVLAYDVDVFQRNSSSNKAENGKYYKYRISICDPNMSKWTYLWISNDFSDWYYHYMSLNASTNVNEVLKKPDGKDEKMIMGVFSDSKIIGIRNPENNIDYVSDENKVDSEIIILNSAPFTLSTESGGSYTVSGNLLSENGGLRKSFNLASSDGGEYSKAQAVYSLPEGVEQNQTITLKPLKGTDRLDADLMFGDYSFSAESDCAKSIEANPKEGSVSLISGKGDFSLSATFNSGCDLPWYTLTVNGENASGASLNVEADGIVMKSDSMKFVRAVAENDTDTVSVTFDTDKESVMFKSAGNNTLAVYIDKDNNGTYETLLTTSGNSHALTGDVNDDGIVNSSDRIYLARYLAKWKGFGSINEKAADVNGDGKVNVRDRIVLARHIAKWRGFETLPCKTA